ncbi:MAG: TonB-dependent receptor [Pseudomonadota bacterium]
MSRKRLVGRFLRTTMLSGVAAAAAMPAVAQDEDDEIIVTGTRIQRADLEAPSPITTIGEEQLTLSNTVNSEQFLNTLPQVIPGLDSSSNNPGNGTATANLRGLGAQRTLVLVDGLRYVPSGFGGIVDLNNIPSALVSSIDVVTGGASAVYGSDAVAGVVNFILKDDFEGVQIDGSQQYTGRGDGSITDVSIIGGGNFADGRGNAVAFLSYSNRRALFQGDRAFSENTFDDPGFGNSGSIPGFEQFDPTGSAGVPGTRIFANGDVSGIGGGMPVIDPTVMTDEDDDDITFLEGTCDDSGLPGGSASVVDPDGSLTFDASNPFDRALGASGDEYCGSNLTFTPEGGLFPWINSGPDTTRFNYAPFNYLQVPQERFNIAGFASYDITENIEFKMRGIFTNNVVPSELAPTPFFSTVTINLDNPFLGATEIASLTPLAGLTDSDGDGTPDLGFDIDDDTGDVVGVLEYADLDNPLNGIIDNDMSGTVTTGDQLDADGNGVADAQVFIGRRMLEVGVRNASQERSAFQFAGGFYGDLGTDMNLGWSLESQYGRTTGSNIQDGNVSISEMQRVVREGECNIFGENNFSADCAATVGRTGAAIGTFDQFQLIGTMNGDTPFTVPWAESPGAFVVGFEYREESSDFRPDSVLGPDVSGFNQSLPVAGRFDVYEAFGEVNLPIVQGKSFFEELSINGQVRYSDYSTIGGAVTFAGGLRWEPIPGYAFRGQFQRAVRAPNVGELFQPVVNGFPGADDPCSDGETSDGRAVSAALCSSVGGGIGPNTVGGDFQSNSQIEGAFGGNVDLEEETGDTFTVGMVAQPEFVPGLTLQVDYFDIEISDVIQAVPIQTVLDSCYDAVNSQAEFCDLITRRGDGNIDFVTLTNQNVALLTAKGIDIIGEYNMDLADFGAADWGSLNFSFIGTYAMEYGFQAIPGGNFDDFAGFYNGDAGEPNPEWKHTLRATHVLGPLSTSLRWRYIGSVTDFNDQDEDTNAVSSIDSFNYLDVSMIYEVSENLVLNAGVENILGKDAPLLGDCCNEQANTWPATYETLGRQFFFGASVRF